MLHYTYSACLLLFASILIFCYKLNLIAMSLFCFVVLDFVPFSMLSFTCAVFMTGHQMRGFNAFLGPSTKIYLGVLPTGIREVITQTKQCK